MSRNSSRTGLPGDKTPEHADPPIGIAPITSADSDLSFTIPTEFVELPSRGRFYPEDHPLHNQTIVEIRHMTAKDEDILSSKALLKQGIAIERFIKNIIVDRSISVDSLLVGDKNAILMAARISGFGPVYDTKVICPVCFAHGRHHFDLGSIEIVHGDDVGDLNVERNEDGNIIVFTPRTEVRIECKLMTGFNEKHLSAQRRRAEKQKLPDNLATSQLILSIVSINDNKDKTVIKKFVQNMPIIDSRYIRKAIEVCSPSVEIRDIYDCPECGACADMEVPFTTDFFWPK